MTNRVVLAYSGGLDTSVAIPYLAEMTNGEVIAVSLDLGQGGEDMESVRQRALDCGAVESVVGAQEAGIRPAPAHLIGVQGHRAIMDRHIRIRRPRRLRAVDQRSADGHGLAVAEQEALTRMPSLLSRRMACSLRRR